MLHPIGLQRLSVDFRFDRNAEVDIGLGQDRALREVARRHQPLCHLVERPHLRFVRLLLARAERLDCALEIAHHAPQAGGLQAERLIGALPRPVQGEVLFEDARPEHIGDQRHGDAGVVPRKPDDHVRKGLRERLDHPEVQLFIGGGIAGRALQDAEIGVDRHDRLVGAPRVLQRRAAGRDDHRLPELRDVLEKRRVGEVAGGDLVGGHVDLLEEIGGGTIEGGGEEDDAEFLGESLQLLILLLGKFELFAVLAVGGRVGVLAVVDAVVHLAREQRPVVALLELHRVRPALGRGAEYRLALFDVALVIVADLGDDEAGRTPVDDLVADLEGGNHTL